MSHMTPKFGMETGAEMLCFLQFRPLHDSSKIEAGSTDLKLNPALLEIVICEQNKHLPLGLARTAGETDGESGMGKQRSEESRHSCKAYDSKI